MEKRVLGVRPPPHKDRVILNCPRCSSPNTKFCYYNNYSLSQPRYFCKSCRRYWTEGGTLRNVPVGGGSRKNKRALPLPNSSSSCTTSTPSARSFPCPSKAVPVPINVGLSGAPGSFSSRNPSFGLQDLALAGNFLLPGTVPLPTEKFFEHGHGRAAFPNSATENGAPPIGLALGSNPSLTITPHFTTHNAMEPLAFPFNFPLEAAMQRVAGGMDTRDLIELQVGGAGDEKLQAQEDESNHQGLLWGGGGGGGGGGYLGAGPW
ncbi:hypothetical protein MLD38_002956 [Melastoma candidum]|uniref:Uncharacterized protein n=1 Tax=Melastoma candidum TaxID=119954 RepID=A0ACB9S2D1_9MYRT|nr:hypothetical protein MLD38_002956 [Melastoma candidum]